MINVTNVVATIAASIGLLLSIACTPESTGGTNPVGAIPEAPASETHARALSIRRDATGSITTYIAIAGDADVVLAPSNLARIEDGKPIGRPWVRLETPISEGAFDLGAAKDTVHFTMELITDHPIGHVPSSVIFAFTAGQPGLSGYIRNNASDQSGAVGFSVDYKGYYRSFPDLGSTWLEFNMAADPILVETKEEAP